MDPGPGTGTPALSRRRQTLDLLADEEALGDLRQSRADFAAGDTFSADQIVAELDRRHRTA